MAKIGKKRHSRRRSVGKNKSTKGGGKQTTRVSLRTIAFLFPHESVQRVYLHGRWQKSRGRNVCLQLGNEPIPRVAYANAEELVGEYLREVLSQRNAYNKWLWTGYRANAIVEAIIRRDPPEEVFGRYN